MLAMLAGLHIVRQSCKMQHFTSQTENNKQTHKIVTKKNSTLSYPFRISGYWCPWMSHRTIQQDPPILFASHRCTRTPGPGELHMRDVRSCLADIGVQPTLPQDAGGLREVFLTNSFRVRQASVSGTPYFVVWTGSLGV